MGVYLNGADAAGGGGGGGGGGTATDSGVLVDISSFSPSALRGLQTWLKADVGVTGNPVSAWADQSPNSLSFAQASAGSQPALIPSAYNSLACVRFDGTDDILQVATNKFNKEEGHTVFAVVKSDDATQDAHIFGLGDGSGDDAYEWGAGIYIYGGKYGMKMTNHASGKQGEYLTQASGASTSLALVSGSMAKTAGSSKGDCWLRVNGTLEAQSVAEPNDWWGYGQTSCGAGNGDDAGIDLEFDGDVCEIIHYNRALTQVEIDSVEAYLTDRWGL